MNGDLWTLGEVTGVRIPPGANAGSWKLGLTCGSGRLESAKETPGRVQAWGFPSSGVWIEWGGKVGPAHFLPSTVCDGHPRASLQPESGGRGWSDPSAGIEAESSLRSAGTRVRGEATYPPWGRSWALELRAWGCGRRAVLTPPGGAAGRPWAMAPPHQVGRGSEAPASRETRTPTGQVKDAGAEAPSASRGYGPSRGRGSPGHCQHPPVSDCALCPAPRSWGPCSGVGARSEPPPPRVQQWLRVLRVESRLRSRKPSGIPRCRLTCLPVPCSGQRGTLIFI